MTLIRKTTLYLQDGAADKIFEVELCRLSQGRYVVNFRHGKRGSYLREGTKTTTPVDKARAEEIFNSVVVAKLNKGFVDAAQPPETAPAQPAPAAQDGAPAGKIRLRIEAAVLKRFQNALGRADIKQMRRAVWRIGELGIKAAVPDLIHLIPANDDLLNYCAAWALGRCGDARAHSALRRLQEKTKAGSVKRITLDALLSTASGDQHRQIMAAIVANLPRPVQQALAANDANQLAAAAGSIIYQGGPAGIALLEDLYRVAAGNACARQYLLAVLNEIPFKPGFFKAIRHIYKAAEFWLDAEVIGLLALRFDIEKPRFYRSSWGDQVRLPGTWKYVSLKKEAAKPDSRVAYANSTRNYFRKRAWRMLRRVGHSDDAGTYVIMATGILKPFTDQHAAAPRQAASSRYVQDADGRWQWVQEAVREYGPFGGYVTFNHILHANSPRYQQSPNGLSWLTVAEKQTIAFTSPPKDLPPREEAFPEIWDQQPEALWHLLTTSQCEPVQRFAARALFDNQPFLDRLTTARIKTLLAQPYALTIELGLTLAKRKYDTAQPDFELIEALLAADLAAARNLARQWVEAQPDLLTQAPALMAHILTSPHADVRQWGGALIEQIALADARIEGLIARMVAFLMGLDDRPDLYAAMIADAGAILLGVWSDYCRRIDLKIIEDLLSHPLAPLQVLAAKLLLQHHTPPAELPPGLIRSLIEAPTPELRGIGVQLFAGLPAELLLRQDDLIFTFCTADDREVRQAARPMVKQLARTNPRFGSDLFDRLFPLIFRKAPSPEYREDLVTLLVDALTQPTQALDHNTIWRLLQARALGARQLGAYLLTHTDPAAFSIRQSARLGNHPLLAVRQWSWQTCQSRQAAIATNMADGLRLLDSNWDDTRAFALDFFRNEFNASHWTPALLVGICDSTREDVQRFGRELITTFFDAAHGVEYLLKLSQHPSINVQLFASNFLEEYAGENLDRIEQLSPYFVTVLSRVNCGRVAKARVFAFLHRIALTSADAAALVAPICDRIAATIAVGDRGTCVQILRDITRRYPQVPTRLVRLPVPRRPPKVPEVDHAV